MLQLPSKAPKFTRAHIAEITRGGSARVRTKSRKNDPLVAMIATADKLLDRYYDAVNEAFGAKIKLPHGERGYPQIFIPDELLNVEWSNGYAFKSLKMIDEQFRLATARAKQRISDAERAIAQRRKGRHEQIVYELECQAASARKAVTLFRKWRGPMKGAFRKERSRLLKVQNRVGLVKARRDVWRLYRSLQKITSEIAARKPSSIKGALAVAGYVESRLWCDKPQIFADEGPMPGKFGPLMRAALSLISSEMTDRQP